MKLRLFLSAIVFLTAKAAFSQATLSTLPSSGTIKDIFQPAYSKKSYSSKGTGRYSATRPGSLIINSGTNNVKKKTPSFLNTKAGSSAPLYSTDNKNKYQAGKATTIPSQSIIVTTPLVTQPNIFLDIRR